MGLAAAERRRIKMITKTAVTAWKLMMPYLGEDAQRAIMQNVRKPMAEYNTSVAKGSRNIAKKYNIDIDTLQDMKNEAVKKLKLKKSVLNSTRHWAKGYLSDIPLPRMDLNNPYARALKKKGLVKWNGQMIPIAERDAYKKDYEILRDKLSENPYRSIINVEQSQGNAKSDFMNNFITRHELSEGSNFEKHYKWVPEKQKPKRMAYKKLLPRDGVTLAKPHTYGRPMSHISLDVLKDELKGGLRSGYPEMLVNEYKHHTFVPVTDRFKNMEMQHVLKVGNKGRHDTSDLFAPDMSILGNLAHESFPYKGSVNTSDVRKMQKNFFDNLHKEQLKHNVKVKGSLYPSELKRYNYVVGD